MSAVASVGPAVDVITAEIDVEARAAAAAARAASLAELASTEALQPPTLLPGVFKPERVLGSDPAGWCDVFRGLAPKLPVQLHTEPFEIGKFDSMDCPPVFKNAVAMLSTFPELEELMAPALPSGEARRARIKMRLATAGKFIHRNRYRRRQILCCLHGQQEWLFISPNTSPGGSDAALDGASHDNWNGFRSSRYPTMMTPEQMDEVAAGMPAGTVTKRITFRAGDVMAFDGRWWHGTSYTAPVLNLFFTPGDDMEVALKEHKRRMAMPMQKGLKMCTISLAKVARLSEAWNVSAEGKAIDWTSIDGHIDVRRSGAAAGAGDADADADADADGTKPAASSSSGGGTRP